MPKRAGVHIVVAKHPQNGALYYLESGAPSAKESHWRRLHAVTLPAAADELTVLLVHPVAGVKLTPWPKAPHLWTVRE